MSYWIILQSQWNLFLQQAATYVFPEAAHKVMPHKENKKVQEIFSNLPFQTLISFHILLYPFWFFGSGAMLIWKMNWFYLSKWYKFQSLFFYLVFIIIEPIRLYLGFHGNMRERIPEITGCFLFTCFPQLIIVLYFLFLQPMMGAGFAMPFDIALNLVYLLMMAPEMVFAYLGAQRILEQQSVLFGMMYKDDLDATNDIKKVQ